MVSRAGLPIAVQPPGTSLVTTVPALRLGIAVLTNQESVSALNAITNDIVDGFMGAPAAGTLLAQAIDEGQMPELIAPFGIERLRTGRLIVDDSLIQKPAAVVGAGPGAAQ